MRSKTVSRLILLILLSATAVVSWLFFDIHRNTVKQDFYREVDQYIDNIEKEAIRLQTAMSQWQSLYIELGDVDIDSFQRIAGDVLDNNTLLSAVAWAPWVVHAQRQVVEASIEQPFFSVPLDPSNINDEAIKAFIEHLDVTKNRKAVPEKKYYLPIVTVEPASVRRAMIGFDYLSLQTTNFGINLDSVFKQAEMSALPVVPNPLSREHEPVLTIIVPIFQRDTQQVPFMRGVIVALLPVDSLFEGSELPALTGLADLVIADVSPAAQGQSLEKLYQMGNEMATIQADSYERNFSIFNRALSITAVPTAKYLASKRSWMAAAVWVIGLLLAWLYYLYVRHIRERTLRIKGLVDKRTRQLRKTNRDLIDLNQQLEQLSQLDQLTGVGNRRVFDEILSKEWRRASRQQHSLALLIIDVDHFKPFNDTYGHLYGDDCLKRIAEALNNVCTRSGDMVTRYGGEEFAVVLPNSGVDAMGVAERCRTAVHELGIEHLSSEASDRVTVSVGMSSVVPTQDMASSLLVDSADKALYLAKLQGRNQVVYRHCGHPDISVAVTERQQAVAEIEKG